MVFTKKPKNLIGKKVGKLTVLWREKLDRQYYWWCQCDCGNKKYISCSNIKKTKTCGCAFKNRITFGRLTHGLSNTRFYQIWVSMNQRTKNPSHKAYKQYKNIKIHWTSFEQFRDDMYQSYLEHVKQFGEKQTSIDRIDGKGNYEKNNCRWATPKEQANNCHWNASIKYKGKFYTKKQLDTIPGLRLHLRVNFLSLSCSAPVSDEIKLFNLIPDVLTPKEQRIFYFRFANCLTLQEIAHEFGCSLERIRQIILSGCKKIFSRYLELAP